MALNVTTSETSGQPCVVLPHPNGSRVEVQLHGATVTSYKSPRGSEVLFLSKKAVFNGSKAIRGGIPLVFPQANFLLDHSEESMAKWPHPFSLRYEVDLAEDALSVILHVTNPGDKAFDFQALLHTYLSVHEIEDVKIEGFRNASYVDQVPIASRVTKALVIARGNAYVAMHGLVGDQLENHSSFKDERPQAEFTSEVDRIYSGHTSNISIVGGTRVSNSCVKTSPGAETCVPVDVVLWNPWIAKAKALADFDDEEYHKMVCIEPGIVSKAHSIAPGETYSLKQVINPM